MPFFKVVGGKKSGICKLLFFLFAVVVFFPPSLCSYIA